MADSKVPDTGRILLFVMGLSLASAAIAEKSGEEQLAWDVSEYVLVFEENTGWKGRDGKETKHLIYTTPGATSDDWTMTLDILVFPIAITFMSEIRWNPASIMAAEKSKMAELGCEDPWAILESDDLQLIYERRSVECQGYLHQHEIGRVIVGKWYAWWLRFRIRDTELSEIEIQALIDHLNQASVFSQPGN